MHDQGLIKNSLQIYSSLKTNSSHNIIPKITDISRATKEVPYLQYLKLALNQQLAHGLFTRHGGVSSAPFQSLNISYSVGDRREDVTKNILGIKEAIGAERLFFLDQSHKNEILLLRKGQDKAPEKNISADAMITDIPGMALLIKQADCQGVIVFDPKKRVVANVHCGWRGNVQNILESVIKKLKKDFACNASDLLAAIGPSLGPCCAEFKSYDKIFPRSFHSFMVRENYFDLWAISTRQLMDAGLREENIELARICTRCRTDLFFSFREEGTTGRFGTVAMLL